MAAWSGDVAPENGDVVLKTADREFLRLKKDGSFSVDGQPGDDGQVAKALRWWLTASGATSWTNGHSLIENSECPKCSEQSPRGCRYANSSSDVRPVETAEVAGRDLVLTVAPSTAVTTPVPPLQVRARYALDTLRASLKERDETRAKAVASLAELLVTFQRIMKPFIAELSAAAGPLLKDRLSDLFDTGGTICIDVAFGLDPSANYVVYHTGRRTVTGPGELATYLVDQRPDLDIEAALNKVATGIEAASISVLKRLSTFDRVMATAALVSQKLKQDEEALRAAEPKALEGPKKP